MLSVFSRLKAARIVNTDKTDFVQLAEVLANFFIVKIFSHLSSVLCSVEILFT